KQPYADRRTLVGVQALRGLLLVGRDPGYAIANVHVKYSRVTFGEHDLIRPTWIGPATGEEDAARRGGSRFAVDRREHGHVHAGLGVRVRGHARADGDVAYLGQVRDRVDPTERVEGAETDLYVGGAVVTQ